MLLYESPDSSLVPLDPEWVAKQLRLYYKVDQWMDELWPNGVFCEFPGCTVTAAPAETYWKPIRSGQREFFTFACLRFPDRREVSPEGRSIILSDIEIESIGRHGSRLIIDGRPLPPICQRHYLELNDELDAEAAFDADIEAYLATFPPHRRAEIEAAIDEGDIRDEDIPRSVRVEPWINAAAFYLYVKMRREQRTRPNRVLRVGYSPRIISATPVLPPPSQTRMRTAIPRPDLNGHTPHRSAWVRKVY